MTTTTTLVTLNVAEIKANPLQARTKVAGIDELAASISSVGLLTPIIVRKAGASHVLVAGQRRLAAVKQLKWTEVSALVVDVAGAREISSMVAENTAREGLSALDLAAAVQQLVGLEASDDEIGVALALDEVKVVQAKIVGALSKEDRKKRLDKIAKKADSQLTLAGAAALARWGDRTGYEGNRLRDAVEHGNDGNLAHYVAQFEAIEKKEAQVRTLVDDLVKRGVTLLKVNAGGWHVPLPTGCASLKDLVGVTVANHKDCSGHAAYVHSYDRPTVVYVCTQFMKQKHKLVSGARGGTEGAAKVAAGKETPAQKKAREAETAKRRTTIANNKAWKIAAPVREKWVAEYLARPNVSEMACDFIVKEIARCQHPLDEIGSGSISARGKKAVSTIDAWRAVRAQLVHAREKLLDRNTWREGYLFETRARYLEFLQAEGYTLSDVEATAFKLNR